MITLSLLTNIIHILTLGKKKLDVLLKYDRIIKLFHTFYFYTYYNFCFY